MFTIHPSAMQLLLPLYNSPQRGYHDLNHIHYCISKLSEYIANINASDSQYVNDHQQLIVTYAIWFHDAIYSPYPFAVSSNERESATLFYEWFNGSEFTSMTGMDSIKFISRVIHAIKATEDHLEDLTCYSHYNDVEDILSTYLMLDIDMAGFTKPFNEVLKDSDRVFKEYETLGLTRSAMLTNRVNFLRKLLAKPRIYYTDYFYDNYEAIARSNIEGVIEASLSEIQDLSY